VTDLPDDPLLARLLRASGSRRDFLAHAARATSAVMLGPLVARRDDPTWRRASADPFTLGVASGDPTPRGVVLWTRLAPDPMHGGGMPAERVRVRWEVAHDDGFRRIARAGDALAMPELAHSVHAEVEGLEPGRDYFYRFVGGGVASPVGRTRTAPDARATTDGMRFAFVSCQNWSEGYFTALRHVAAEDQLDLVVHLGDYIYEYGIREKIVRPHEGPEVTTLDMYRGRHALYKSDPDLRAAHARAPWLVTWDDHDVSNNYAGAVSQHADPVDAFLARRAAAYQAYYEHLPLRLPQKPSGPNAQMYRRLGYGQVATFHVLDTRQYRSDQPCGDGRKPRCPDALDPATTMMGEAQERWLFDGLAASPARWNIIANQVPFAQVDENPGPDVVVNMDKWDGYAGARQRVLDFLAERRPRNPVFITGDMHFNIASDVKASFDDPSSRTVAAELVGTSISSGFDGQDLPKWGESLLRANPHMRFLNQQRGYVRCTLTAERLTGDYRVIPFVTKPDAPVSTRATMIVEDGKPGLAPA
jgi:alkaline phosphatase D